MMFQNRYIATKLKEIHNRKHDPMNKYFFMGLLFLSGIATSQEIEDISFAVIDENTEELRLIMVEEPPVFPACEGVAKEKSRRCFDEQFYKHIAENFRYPEAAQKAKIEGRVMTTLRFDEAGNVTIKEVSGPDPILEEGAVRIFKLLPKLKPAKHGGRIVRVLQTVPITFKLQ